SEQVTLRPGLEVVVAGAAPERAPDGSLQNVLHLPQLEACQLSQVSGGQATAGGSHQAEQVLLRRTALQQAPQLLPGKSLHVPCIRRLRERPDDLRVAQRVP